MFLPGRLARASVLLKMADRLNQMPLGIIGIALGTAILPVLSRYIHNDESGLPSGCRPMRLKWQLLTLPAAAAMVICAPAFVTAFFFGGKFKREDDEIIGRVIAMAWSPACLLM